jgi:PRC-barrel domain
MLKKLMIGTALSAFALSGAFAQSNPSTDPPANSQQSQSTSSGGSSMNNSSSMDKSKSPSAASSTSSPSSATTGQASSPSPSASSTASMPSASGSQQFVSSQQTNQWLSSKFIGIDVVGADDKKIGDVSDVLFDQQGKIEAYVIGVGGFLGIGAKDVALAPSAFQPVKDNNNNERLKLSMTKDQLEKAPAFERKQEPRATTGAGSPSSGMGSPRPTGAPGGTPR